MSTLEILLLTYLLAGGVLNIEYSESYPAICLIIHLCTANFLALCLLVIEMSLILLLM